MEFQYHPLFMSLTYIHLLGLAAGLAAGFAAGFAAGAAPPASPPGAAPPAGVNPGIFGRSLPVNCLDTKTKSGYKKLW